MIDINMGQFTQAKIEETQYQEIFEKTGFNIKSFNQIVSDQDVINSKIDSDWKIKGNDWYLAILLETGELLDSIDWKWWKKGSTDWFNLKIEMIDLLFFIISKGIETGHINKLIPLFISHSVSNTIQDKVTYDESLAKKISDIIRNEFLINVTVTENLIGATNVWLKVWYMMGFNADEIFKTYKMKHTLNIFRQDHGYKTGEYIKMWNGIEDNLAAQQIVDTMEDSVEFSTDLYNNLEDAYNELEKKEEKSFEKFAQQDPMWSPILVQIPEANRNVMIDLAKDFQKYLEN